MSGRPRRINVRRKPSGDVVESQTIRQEDPRTLTAWKRAAAYHMELGLSPAISTTAGRLFVVSKLSYAQFEAASRWSEMLENYDVLIMGRSRRSKPPAYERRSPGESAERSQEHIESFLGNFHPARQALLVAGKISEIAVNRLCREEGAPIHFDDISRGLDALAAHWQLTETRKHATRGK